MHQIEAPVRDPWRSGRAAQLSIVRRPARCKGLSGRSSEVRGDDVSGVAVQ